MKIKVTNKQIKENYKNIIVVGYCELQHLLQGLSTNYYNCGVYGWNYDVYQINSRTLIITGYRPPIKGTIRPKREFYKPYEDKATAIMLDYSIDYTKRLGKIEKLRCKFIKELLEEN